MKSSSYSAKRLHLAGSERRLTARQDRRRDADGTTRDACAPRNGLKLSLFLVAVLVLAALPLRAESNAAATNRFVRDGVAVELILSPPDGVASSSPVRAGESARIRFTITDTTTGQPLTRLHPAAWLSRRDSGSAARPRSCSEKVQELLGGSVFSKAELDLNTFQVVALNDDATLTVVDPLFGFGGTKLLALIALPGVGTDWALSLDQKKLFVTVPSAGKIAVVDTAQWKVSGLLEVGGSPSRLVLQPDGHYLWVASTGTKAESAEDQLAVIATERDEVVGKIPLRHGPHEIVFSADSRWAFVTSASDQSLAVIDVHRLQTSKDVALGCKPVSAAYSKVSEAVYLADQTKGTVLVFDAVKHEIVGRIPVEPGVSELKFSPDERFGFIANPTDDLVEILDTASNRIIQRAKIEGGPEQISFSNDMAYVLCRSSASVAMIPLKEIGREGQPVPVAQFVGGEAAFGARKNRAESIVAAPGESAVVVANAADKAVYYYMQGMAAPMGNFSNYGREPRAVAVIDRSLREVAPGIYETSADLPAAGDYDAVFFLDSPRITHCFSTTITPNSRPDRTRGNAVAWLQPLSRPKLVAGQRIRLKFQLEGESHPETTEITLRTVLAPGVWHARETVTPASDGTVTWEFTPPEAGTYYFYAAADAPEVMPSDTPVLILHASDAGLAAIK